MITIDVYGEEGFKATFPYDTNEVTRIKLCAGFNWSKGSKAWIAPGPEVVLDLQRYRIECTFTPAALERANSFVTQIKRINAVKYQKPSGVLYDYQRIGTASLIEQQRAILGDDPGLGKSKQALDAAVAIKATKILVLAPKTLTYNWRDEIEKWHPGLKFGIAPDAPKARYEFWQSVYSGKVNVVIANYEKVILNDWPMMPWDCVIADEIHFCKNHKAARSKKVKEIGKRTPYFFGLSGTPMEIRPDEIHGVMTIVRPAVLGGYWRFREQHLVQDSWGTIIGFRQGGAELLKERIAPWMIRRKKDDTLGLPPKIYHNEFCELSAVERAVYTQLKKHFLKWIQDNERDMNEANALTQLLRLQQFTSSPMLLGQEIRGAKWDALQSLIAENPGKVVVFTRFAEMAKLLQQWTGTPYLIAGEVDAKERVSTVTRFNDSSSAKVLVSTDAGAYGLNITSADLVIHYDQLWNPGKMWQREDRLHRIGQKGTVRVVNLVCAETLDEGMIKVLQQRREVFKDIVDGAEDAAIKKLGASSISKLISGRM